MPPFRRELRLAWPSPDSCATLRDQRQALMSTWAGYIDATAPDGEMVDLATRQSA